MRLLRWKAAKAGSRQVSVKGICKFIGVTTHEEPAWHTLTTIGLPNERPEAYQTVIPSYLTLC